MNELTMPEIICKVGQSFEIDLRSIAASTGYVCALAHKPDCLWLEGEATHLEPGPFPPITMGKMIFTFLCLVECKEQLVFKYVKPWDLKDIGQKVIFPIVCNK
jgi:hypothetical protein